MKLLMKYEFTDRGGNEVFSVFEAGEGVEAVKKGEVRLPCTPLEGMFFIEWTPEDDS